VKTCIILQIIQILAYRKRDAQDTNNKNFIMISCNICVIIVVVRFAKYNHAVWFAEQEVPREFCLNKKCRCRAERSANNDARHSGAWSRHVTLLTRSLPTDRGRVHCHTDRSTQLFHLRRLRISFTVQTQTHIHARTHTTYASFSYSARAVKRDNINHNANVRNCPFCCSATQQSGILTR